MVRLEPKLVGIFLTTAAVVTLIPVNRGPLLQRVEMSRNWMLDNTNTALITPYEGQVLKLDPIQTSVASNPTRPLSDIQPPQYYTERDLFADVSKDPNSEASIIKYLQRRVRSQVSKKKTKQQGWTWGDFNRFGDDEVSVNFNFACTAATNHPTDLPRGRFFRQSEFIWRRFSFWSKNTIWECKFLRLVVSADLQ